jgi:hypothetical protein
VESLWADYFEPRPGIDWDPPHTDDPAAIEIMRRISAAMREDVSEQTWVTWIAPVRATNLLHSPLPNLRVLVVAYPSRGGQEWLFRNFGAALQEKAIAAGIAGMTYWWPESAVRTEEQRA